MKQLSFFILLIAFNLSFAQIFEGEEISANNIKAWNVKNTNDYEGVYAFGSSEGETQVTLTIHKNIICLQIENNGKEIFKSGQFAGWERNIQNYTNVKIIGNKFYSDQSNGAFVSYQQNGKKTKCLKLDTPPVDMYDGKFELGSKASIPMNDFFAGKYIQTKHKVLSTVELQKLSKQELKIMRNEIFARYGYTFKKGGAMEKYFSKQSWYSPRVTSVDSYLTAIEKKNIENILKVEKGI